MRRGLAGGLLASQDVNVRPEEAGVPSAPGAWGRTSSWIGGEGRDGSVGSSPRKGKLGLSAHPYRVLPVTPCLLSVA